MQIGPDVLRDEAARAVRLWPFVLDLEQAYELPRFLMLAVGSVETNLSPAYTDGHTTGDGGHGHGVMQLDDRSHTIPAGFDGDAHAQFETAASMLSGLLDAEHGDVVRACNRYNSGSPSDKAATHGSGANTWVYGHEVADRLAWLTANFHPPAAPAPTIQQEDDSMKPVAGTPSWCGRQKDGAFPRFKATPDGMDAVVVSIDNAPFTPPWAEGVHAGYSDFAAYGLWCRRLKGAGEPYAFAEVAGAFFLIADHGTFDVAHEVATTTR